jgi:hypothetical protein
MSVLSLLVHLKNSMTAASTWIGSKNDVERKADKNSSAKSKFENNNHCYPF